MLRFFSIALVALALGPTFLSRDGASQAPAIGEQAWRIETEARLKAIFVDNELKPKQFTGHWLPDSTGVVVQEKDPITDNLVSVQYDVHTGNRRVIADSSKSPPSSGPNISPDGSKSIEIQEKNLCVRNVASGDMVIIASHDADRDVVYRDPTWSPDGERVLFVEADFTDVRIRNILVPSDPTYPDVKDHRFARVGEKIERLRVGVVDCNGKNLKWLAIEQAPEGFYLGKVDWACNSNEVVVERLNRFRNKREFLLANIQGDVEQIFAESNDTWVESSQGKNSGLTWVRNGEAFVVISEMDGWRHAYLWSRQGKKISLITPGSYDIIDRGPIDEEGGWFYFYASPENATEVYLYRAPLDLDGAKKVERLTPNNLAGTHRYEFSPDKHWAVHTYSALDAPPVTELVKLPEHSVVVVLEENAKLREKAKDWISIPTEFLKLEIDSGILLDAWMIKPKDFDPSKKYPVLVYVYGEPHAQTVLNEWGAAQMHFHRVVADLGYLVVSIDNRGTPAPKGAEWRRAVFGSLGPLSTEEQEAGLKQLGRMRSYVDLSRVAIWGWSGGGSNTLNAMFRKADSYHVGIAVVPKPQPHLYNAWFQEMYMQTPEVNSEGYKKAAAINYADGLKGNLLIITGSGETNTHIQIIEGLVDRLIELGKSFDYMVYPNRDHGLSEGLGSKVHVRMLIVRYLKTHLSSGGR